MFSFGSGKASNPNSNTGSPINRKSPKNKYTPQVTPISPESLEPAIDGPPSPERIRAYTEQMKRSSIFGNNSAFGNSSRTNTFSSATSSSRSRDSTYIGVDNVSLSRRSSGRSNASSMPSLRTERPESSQGFGSIFSRNGRRRRATNADALRTSNSSFSLSDITLEEGTKDYNRKNGHRRRHFISEPYNFQHVTHTQQEHLPNLARASRTELVSEFSTLRTSQAPTNGELKGIRAQDLHFENFSSEALSTSEDPVSRGSSKSPGHRAVLRKPKVATPHQRTVSYAKSHDNLRTPLRSPPPRPPRPAGSPLSPECPMELPVRTSSRTASILFDPINPLASTTIERPYQNAGFRRPAPLNLPTPSSPLAAGGSEPQEYFSSRPLSHAVSTPMEEAWPLTGSPSGNFGVELDDVQEEDEDESRRKSRISATGSDLRQSRSVDELPRISREQGRNRPETRMSTTLGPSPYIEGPTQQQKQPLSPGFQIPSDSWESDIDWCYENGVEGDCDYQWVDEDSTPPATHPAPSLELQVQDDERVYHGRFRPSLLVPSSMDPPELSPASTNTISSLRTPTNMLRPNHIRTHSQASTFKESHGFTLSPTLLIPSDFQAQMDQDTIYSEQFSNDSGNGTIFLQQPYNHSVSSVDEGGSSTASYRSSDFSRNSARSSSSTRISGPHSRGSQDSTILFSHAEGIKELHRSTGSALSIPELVASDSKQSQAAPATDLSAKLAALQLKVTSHPADLLPSSEKSGLHRRNKSLHFEHASPNVPSLSTLPSLTIPSGRFFDSNSNLTPVEEIQGAKEHERKISAPVVSPSVREFKGRARAHTASAGSLAPKKRGSYMLFPQV